MSSQPEIQKTPDANQKVDNLAGKSHWEGVAADENGMLGGVPAVAGYGFVSRVDLQGSRGFLAKLGVGRKAPAKRVGRAVEGGAGIGRVTEGLLLDVAEVVDVIEPVVKFTDALKGKAGVGEIYNVGLEDWRPTEGVRYDLVWTQWCVGHLTDEQLIGYLQRCRDALNPEGIIVVKENLSTLGSDYLDKEDRSVTREDGKFLSLFERAGLRVIRSEIQKGIPAKSPRKLLPVKTYALKPKAGPESPGH